jgi:DNA-directed RNA polymerase sigma subunit (sigma70/sigma32)
VQRFLNSLDKRSREIFVERYIHHPHLSYKQLAEKYLMTEERVQSIEYSVIGKLIDFITHSKDIEIDTSFAKHLLLFKKSTEKEII